MLDIGCGVGAFLRLVADRGGEPYGHRRLRGADRARAHAPARTPTCASARWRTCPGTTTRFDLVTGFNSFFFANDMVAALARSRPRRQARRTGRDPGLGRARALRPRGDEATRPAVPAAAPARRTARPRPLAAGALEALATQAGLTPESEFDATWAFEYPDAETLGRALVAVAGLAVLAGPEREQELKTAIVDGLAPYRTPDGELPALERVPLPDRARVSTFAVIREAGPAWRNGGISEQPAVDEHAAFMNALADRGFLLFGGPLAGTEHGRVRVLLIVNAEHEDEIRRRLADDPWVLTEQLVTVSIEPWQLLVGAERIPSAQAI